jgi:hypothetical protein
MEARVILLPEDVLNGPLDVVQMQSLSVPFSRQVILSDSGSLLELTVVQRKLGSWFIDESVEGSGQLFVGTPLDPFFVLLPLFVKNQSQFRPLDDVVTEGGASYVKLFARDKSLAERVLLVCDVKVAICFVCYLDLFYRSCWVYFVLVYWFLFLLSKRKFLVWMVDLCVCRARSCFGGCCAKWRLFKVLSSPVWRDAWRRQEARQCRDRWL